MTEESKQRNFLVFGSKACHHWRSFYSLSSAPSKKCVKEQLSKPSCAFCLQKNHVNPIEYVWPTKEAPKNTKKKRQKTTLIKPLFFHNGEASDLWILQTNEKNNTYLLNTILISELDPRLKLYPRSLQQKIKNKK